VVTILAALAPAIGGTNVEDAPAVIRAGSRHASAAHGAVRWRQLLVGAQAAIATALLISASLLLASFWRLGRVPLGFDADKVVTVEMRLLDPKYRDSTTLRRFQDDLLAAVSAIPGVTDAGLASAVPFRGVDFLTVF